MNWYHGAIPVERDYQREEAYRRTQRQRLVKESTGVRPHQSLTRIFHQLTEWIKTHLPQPDVLPGETFEINLEALPENSGNLS